MRPRAALLCKKMNGSFVAQIISALVSHSLAWALVPHSAPSLMPAHLVSLRLRLLPLPRGERKHRLWASSGGDHQIHVFPVR